MCGEENYLMSHIDIKKVLSFQNSLQNVFEEAVSFYKSMGLDAVTAQARETRIRIVQPIDISGTFFFQKFVKIKLFSCVACFWHLFCVNYFFYFTNSL